MSVPWCENIILRIIGVWGCHVRLKLWFLVSQKDKYRFFKRYLFTLFVSLLIIFIWLRIEKVGLLQRQFFPLFLICDWIWISIKRRSFPWSWYQAIFWIFTFSWMLEIWLKVIWESVFPERKIHLVLFQLPSDWQSSLYIFSSLCYFFFFMIAGSDTYDYHNNCK